MNEFSSEKNHSFRLLLGTILFSLLFLIPCALIVALVPIQTKAPVQTLPQFEVEAVALEEDVPYEAEIEDEELLEVSYSAKAQDFRKKIDEGLSLYRQPYSKRIQRLSNTTTRQKQDYRQT